MKGNLQRQIDELIAVHKGLRDIVEHGDETVVSGVLPFEASADELETITESFEIELTIPRDFPESLPRAREIGGRIEINYEHRNPSGTLCLAVPVEQRRIFLENPTLLGFVNRLVIPYLYGYCFFKRYGRHPFDEAAHGYEGILRHYADTLDLRDNLSVLAVVSYLLEYGYRGHHDCPCGSGKKVRTCHGPALMTLYQAHNQHSLRGDFIAIFSLCFSRFENQKLTFPKHLKLQLLRLLNTFKN